MQLEIKVNIGVTRELAELVRELTGSRVETRQPEPVAAREEEPRPQAIEIEVEKPAEEPKPEEPKELTEQDIRDAMHDVRRRIEGEDYMNKTASEGYKKYHKVLTNMFLQIAGELGADKPSMLPADKRETFCLRCAELGLNKEGMVVVEDLPF